MIELIQSVTQITTWQGTVASLGVCLAIVGVAWAIAYIVVRALKE